jgi:hypothetical protein
MYSNQNLVDLPVDFWFLICDKLDSKSLYQFYLTGNHNIINMLAAKTWTSFDIEIDMGKDKHVSWPSILKRLHNLHSITMNVTFDAGYSYMSKLFDSGTPQFESLASPVLKYLTFTQQNVSGCMTDPDRADGEIEEDWQDFDQLDLSQLFPNLESLAFDADAVMFTNGNLRSLPSTMTYLELANHDDIIDYGDLPRSLQNLLLWSEIHMKSGHTLWNLPPQLHTLKLYSLDSARWEDFANLPSTITCLELCPNESRWAKEQAAIPLEQINFLPRGLKHLNIRLKITAINVSNDNMDLLPFPHLEALRFYHSLELTNSHHYSMFCKTPKPALKYIQIGNSSKFHARRITIQSDDECIHMLPQKLIMLLIYPSPSLTIQGFANLPPSLECLGLDYNTHLIDDEALAKHLPASIAYTSLPRAGFEESPVYDYPKNPFYR